jgi:porin
MSLATMWSMPFCGAANSHTGNFSITAAYYKPIAPGIRVGIGLGYTDHPTPVICTPQTGSALNLLANVVTYW